MSDSAHDITAGGRGAAEAQLIDIHRILEIIGERWLGAVLTAIVLCGAVGWVLLREIPVYSATSTLLIERSNDRVVNIQQVVDNTVDSSLSDALLLTHIQQVRSNTFTKRLAASLNPEESAAALAPYPEKTAGGGVTAGSAEDIDSARLARLEAMIEQGLKVERASRTLLITLTMRHRDPAMAQALANRAAQEYILYLIDRNTASNVSAVSFLSKQAEELRDQVQTAEQTLQAYREEHNLFFLEQNQNIFIEKLRSMSIAVTQARVARLGLDARVEQATRILQVPDRARQLSSLPEFGAYAAVQKQLDELRAKREVMAERYLRKHPQMMENETSRIALQRLRDEQIQAALRDLESQRQKAVTQEEQLAAELGGAEKESLRLDQLAVRYNFLRREIETTRNTYSQILARLNETTVSSRLQNTNIKLADNATRPVLPFSPNRLRIFAALGVLGLILVVGYPLARNALDRRVRSWADIELFLGGPLLAEMSLIRRRRKSARQTLVAVGADENITEEFRALYNQIRILPAPRPPMTLLLTSTIPSEGKSFIATNLASVFAAHGHRVLLVDADFRRPSLHRGFKLENDHGLLPWLTSVDPSLHEPLENELLGIRMVAPQVWFLRSGGVSRKVTELLETTPIEQLLATLAGQFDVVLLDTAPAGVFPDAEAMAAFADGIVYVCRFEGPHRTHVRQSLDRLRKRTEHFLGIVLNAKPAHRLLSHTASSWSRGRRYYRSYHRQR